MPTARQWINAAAAALDDGGSSEHLRQQVGSFEALRDAVASAEGGGTIELTASIELEATLVFDGVSIELTSAYGRQFIVSGVYEHRLFEVRGGAQVSFSNLVFKNGEGADGGGALHVTDSSKVKLRNVEMYSVSQG